MFLSTAHLTLYKSLFGEMSKEYFFLAQRYKTKNPRTGVKLKQCFSTDPMLKFQNLIMWNSSFSIYTVNKPIRFEEFSFGCDIREIKGNKGAPSCVNYFRVGERVVQINGYRKLIQNMPTKQLFFTLNGKFFLGEHLFLQKNDLGWEQIARNLFRYYNVKESCQPLQFYFVDEEGAILCFVDDGFSISLKYYNSECCMIHPELYNIWSQRNNEKDLFPSLH